MDFIFDANLSHNAYHKAREFSFAVESLEAAAGKQWNGLNHRALLQDAAISKPIKNNFERTLAAMTSEITTAFKGNETPENVRTWAHNLNQLQGKTFIQSEYNYFLNTSNVESHPPKLFRKVIEQLEDLGFISTDLASQTHRLNPLGQAFIAYIYDTYVTQKAQSGLDPAAGLRTWGRPGPAAGGSAPSA